MQNVYKKFSTWEWMEEEDGFSLEKRELDFSRFRINNEWIYIKVGQNQKVLFLFEIFTIFELGKMFMGAGFESLENYSDFNREEWSLNLPRTVILASKYEMIIYTIGHSTRTLEELVNILKLYGIEIVVDVRRFPGSKKFPHFGREYMEDYLEKKGIDYFWLGDLLGGYRKEGYEKYMKSDDFKEGIKDLMKISEKGNTAIMCAELLWFRCHRKFISDALLKSGYKVVHIVDEKRTYEHGLREKSPELFD